MDALRRSATLVPVGPARGESPLASIFARNSRVLPTEASRHKTTLRTIPVPRVSLPGAWNVWTAGETRRQPTHIRRAVSLQRMEPPPPQGSPTRRFPPTTRRASCCRSTAITVFPESRPLRRRGTRWPAYHTCVPRVTHPDGWYTWRATMVRTTTGKRGRPTVLLPPDLTARQVRVVAAFVLARWLPSLSCASRLAPRTGKWLPCDSKGRPCESRVSVS